MLEADSLQDYSSSLLTYHAILTASEKSAATERLDGSLSVSPCHWTIEMAEKKLGFIYTKICAYFIFCESIGTKTHEITINLGNYVKRNFNFYMSTNVWAVESQMLK